MSQSTIFRFCHFQKKLDSEFVVDPHFGTFGNSIRTKQGFKTKKNNKSISNIALGISAADTGGCSKVHGCD